MTNLAKRVLFGVPAAALTLFAVSYSVYGALALCLLISVLGLQEFLRISGVNSKLIQAANIIIALGIWAGVYLALSVDKTYLLLTLLFVVSIFPINGIWFLYRKKEAEPFKKLAVTVFAFLYCFFPMIFLFLFSVDLKEWWNYDMQIGSGLKYYAHIPLGLLLCVWSTDSFAYFGGKYLGKHKLFERISPKKTWEGSIIGGLGCLGVGILFQIYFPAYWNWIVVSVLVAIFSQFGDLVESMLKRNLAIKDSGGIFPGHGGVLDRFDGFYVLMPILFVYYLMSEWLLPVLS